MAKKELKISVGNRLVDTKIEMLKVVDLHFYPLNPRISSILMNFKGKISDSVIHELMYKHQPEATRTLYRRIKLDGIVNEPLIVYKNKTLEGNTRLWVVRELYNKEKTKKNKERWLYVPCRVVTEKLSDKEINFILCNVHIKKKKDWQPFEQACYFAQMHEKEGMNYNQISKLTEFGYWKVSDYIKTFQEMRKRKEKPEKFNYYYETIRQPDVKKEIKKHKISILDVVQKKIKEGKIKSASDVRKISTILKDDRAKKVFFNGEANIKRAEEIALITNPQEGDALLKKISELTEDLKHIQFDKLQAIKKDKTKIKIIEDLLKQVNSLCKDIKKKR